jgi:protein subunit release factor A
MDALLRQALERAEEVARALADPATARDSGKLQSLGREHSRLVPIQRIAERLVRLRDELGQAREVAADTTDPEMAELAAVDVERLPAEIEAAERELGELLIPRDPLEDRDAIIELRAGTGGDEAALFAADLFRITRFAGATVSRLKSGMHEGTLRHQGVIAAIRGGPRSPAPGIRRPPRAAGSGDRRPGVAFTPPRRRSRFFLKPKRST